MNSGHELWALDAMKISGQWLTLATLGRELKALYAMNNLTLWKI